MPVIQFTNVYEKDGNPTERFLPGSVKIIRIFLQKCGPTASIFAKNAAGAAQSIYPDSHKIIKKWGAQCTPPRVSHHHKRVLQKSHQTDLCSVLTSIPGR
jgi:hypothetical protein